MVLEPVPCPSCQNINVFRHGRSAEGKSRYRCLNPDCQRNTFILNYSYNGYRPEVKQQIIDMALNGSGIRDTARVLKISPSTVIEELKKAPDLTAVNAARLSEIEPSQTIVNLCQWEDVEAEADEMWSFVGDKSRQRCGSVPGEDSPGTLPWLWHAIDHHSGAVLAYVLAVHEDEAFIKLKGLLEPFGITQFYTDGWGAYERHLNPAEHIVGKRNTQKIERKHLTFRTRIKRLARKTICFSKSVVMHDVVIGLFINRFEFGCAV